jgi:hypothetical protein
MEVSWGNSGEEVRRVEEGRVEWNGEGEGNIE